jgi:hypothetical protein
MRLLGRWAYFFLPKSKCLVVVVIILLWADVVVVAEAAVRASVRQCAVECMGLGVH